MRIRFNFPHPIGVTTFSLQLSGDSFILGVLDPDLSFTHLKILPSSYTSVPIVVIAPLDIKVHRILSRPNQLYSF